MKIRNISEALLPRKKVEYYIDGIIRPSSLNMFHAEPGTGKSLAFITMGICFAAPEIDNWLGFEISKKGNVLFIQEEMGDEGFLEFMEEVYRGFFGGKNKKLPFDFTIYQGVNFSNETSINKLSNEVKKREYRLIFSDSFAATTSDNEDKKEDMQPALKRAQMITTLPSEPAIIFTHHPVKSGNGYRGSGAIKAAMDLMVSMKGKGADKIEFKMEKNRYKPCKEWEAKKIFEKDMSGKDVFSLERTGSPDGLKERQEMMISIIENNPDYGQSELYEAYVRLGGKKIDATGILKILDESEVTEIVSDSIGGKGKKKIRRLTEAYLSQEMNQSVAESVKKLLNNGHK